MNDQEETQSKKLHGDWKVLEGLLRGDRQRDEALAADAAEEEKLQRKQEYEAFNRKLSELRLGKYAYFLNYGYVQNHNPHFSKVVPRDGEFDTNSRRLIYEVIGECPLDDSEVVDVGCGRGAVPIALQGHFRPSSYRGIDLSSEAIAFCRERHKIPNVRFETGDAESLPLASEAFDVLINIESSHNYPHIEAFFHECLRVLRPNGWFLYTDFMAPEAFDRHTQLLQEIGFAMTRAVDITSNVLRSCDETASTRMQAYQNPEQRAYMADFLAAPGSKTYRVFEQGLLCYRLFTFRKIASAT